MQGQGHRGGAGGAQQRQPGTGGHPVGERALIHRPSPKKLGEASRTTTTAYIEPGSLWEEGLAESFNGSFRDEYLNTELLTTAPDAQLITHRWDHDHSLT